MSRHDHHKKKSHAGKKSVKKRVPSKSPANTTAKKNTSSSDDDYAGVDLITDEDSEDLEEADISMLESGRVQESEEDSEDSLDEDGIGFDTFELPSYLDENTQFFDDNFLSIASQDLVSGDIGHDEEVTDNVYSEALQAQQHSSHNSSDNSGDDTFDPDLQSEDDAPCFFALESFPPAFQRAVNDVASSEASSCWDLEAERGQQLYTQAEDANDDDNHSESGSLSGYETDIGETTEEDEDLPAKFKAAPRSVLRPISQDSENAAPVDRSKKIRPPRMGTFIEEGEKHFAMTDSSGGRLLVWEGQEKRSNPTPNVMMGLHMSLSDLSNAQQWVAPEFFFPPGAFENVPFDSSSYTSYGEEDDESDVAMENFINFGESNSEEEMGNGEEATEPPSSTPARAPIPEGEQSNVLGHLGGANVGIFRQHQSQHALLSRNAATSEGLAFKNSYGNGPIRGIKGGRLAAANTPITPARKQKKGVKNIAASSPGSPLVARATSLKHKASDKVTKKAHKRNRSIY